MHIENKTLRITKGEQFKGKYHGEIVMKIGESTKVFNYDYGK